MSVGYIFLIFSLFSGAVKGFCGKRTSGYVDDYKDALFTNFVRMILCIVIGMFIILIQGNVKDLVIDGTVLLTTLLSGVTTSVFVVTWLVSVKRGAYMMLDVFLMLGVIVPVLLSKIIFGEEIGINRQIGFVILVTAVLIMCSYNNQIKEKMSITLLILLIICGAANGLTDFSQKLYVNSNDNVAVFNLYTYVFSAIVLFVFYIVEKIKETPKPSDANRNTASKDGNSTSEIQVMRHVGGYVIVMSICLFANSFFKTLAAKHLPPAVLYPLNQGAALIISSFMSMIFFKEKLTPRCVVGLILSFVALLIINLL